MILLPVSLSPRVDMRLKDHVCKVSGIVGVQYIIIIYSLLFIYLYINICIYILIVYYSNLYSNLSYLSF